jgi:hypothetical protein
MRRRAVQANPEPPRLYLGAAVLREVAVATELDPRTVARCVDGSRAVRASTVRLVQEELARRGLLASDRAEPEVADASADLAKRLAGVLGR